MTWHIKKRHSALATGLILLSAMGVSLLAENVSCIRPASSAWKSSADLQPVQSTALTVANVSQTCIDAEDLNDPDIPYGILPHLPGFNTTPAFMSCAQSRASYQYTSIDVLSLAPGRSPPHHS